MHSMPQDTTQTCRCFTFTAVLGTWRVRTTTTVPNTRLIDHEHRQVVWRRTTTPVAPRECCIRSTTVAKRWKRSCAQKTVTFLTFGHVKPTIPTTKLPRLDASDTRDVYRQQRRYSLTLRLATSKRPLMQTLELYRCFPVVVHLKNAAKFRVGYIPFTLL